MLNQNNITKFRNIKIELKETTDKYYAIFNQKELLQKAYNKIVKNKTLKKMAQKHQLALL